MGIIFDFDGVISHSIEVKTNAFYKLYEIYGKEITDKVVDHHKSNGGVSRFEKLKFYHKNFLNRNITENELQILLNEFSNNVIDGVIKAPYVDGVLDYIKESSKKYKLFISTATPTDEIKKIIKEKGIEKYFTDIYGSPSKKTAHIDIIMKKYGFKTDQLVFIGDSETDLSAAIEKKIKFILIENKYNKLLRQKYAGTKIKSFKDLK